MKMLTDLRTNLHLRLAALAAIMIAMQPALRAEGERNPPSAGQSGTVSLEYMGAAGWRITDGTTVILIDPYLSRIIGPPPPGRVFVRAPGDTRPAYGWDDVAVPDAAAIESHVKRADFILVTHTHYDHVLDVPHLALTTKATVIGTESTENVLRTYR
jgi:L-ascorbate metabolism protein UlaG (beta-lactamase superfamily)